MSKNYLGKLENMEKPDETIKTERKYVPEWHSGSTGRGIGKSNRT
jgi:predicted GNAT family acetyltransferase